MSSEKPKALESSVDSYYSSSDTDAAYKTCWGEGNIHFGYFAHLEDKSQSPSTFQKAAEALTDRMIQLGGITQASRVVDLGCGYGKPICRVAKQTSAQVCGVDLSAMHIEKAVALAKKMELKNAKFVKGSFTDLPKEVLDQTFTHVWSQVAWCHVHEQLDKILEQAAKCLPKGGKLIVNDFLGTDGEVKEETKEHVYKRLKFTQLAGHQKWRKAVESAGFKIETYEDLDRHIGFGYEQLAATANKYGFKSADGTPLGTNYEQSAKAAGSGQIGMNICVATKL